MSSACIGSSSTRRSIPRLQLPSVAMSAADPFQPRRAGRGIVEACRSVDVNRLHREGCLRAGWVGGWQWTRDGEKVAWISLRAGDDRLHLTYRMRMGGGGPATCPPSSALRCTPKHFQKWRDRKGSSNC
jgi:hypothetical protein